MNLMAQSRQSPRRVYARGLRSPTCSYATLVGEYRSCDNKHQCRATLKSENNFPETQLDRITQIEARARPSFCEDASTQRTEMVVQNSSERFRLGDGNAILLLVR